MKEFKKAVFEACKDRVDSMVKRARSIVEAAQEAANNETKSSMGDKYETGRATAQREKAQAEEFLAEALKLETILNRLDPGRTFATIQPGSLIETSGGIFFIGPALGKIEAQGKSLFAISLVSPIGQVFEGKKTGDVFTFRGKEWQIKGVW